MAAAVVLAATSQAPHANCINFGGFPIFQCADNAFFQPPPDFDPNVYVLDPNGMVSNISAVFWQIGFGNRTLNTGFGTAGTGIGGGLTTFNGNDSGMLTPNLRDGLAAGLDPNVPPGSVCLSASDWANSGVDGCCDNPRSNLLLSAADNILNPYYDVYNYRAGSPASYSLDWQQDYPMAVLLKNVDGTFFAIAAVATLNRGNTGGNGVCNTGAPGTNPAACDFRVGFYAFKDVKNGLPNPIDPNVMNVIPWQPTPAPVILDNTLVDPNDPDNSPHVLDIGWVAPTIYSDLSARPSTNPGMGGGLCTSGSACDANVPTNDPTRSPGVGVSDIAGKFGGLVRYVLEVADPGDPNFAFPVTTFPTMSASIAGLSVPVNDCIRIRTLFGKAAEAMITSANNCRLGKCGDIGYEVVSTSKCIPPDPNAFACTATPEVCDGLDNDCDVQVDEGNPGGGVPCATGLQGLCAAGTTACHSPSLACVQNIQPSAEACDGLDNDCDGSVDEGIAPVATTCGAGVCAASGSMTCTAGQLVDSCTAGTPGAEVCDTLDNDCNGVVDDPVGGCTLFVTNPLSAGVLDCHSPATFQPTIVWNKAQYDRFKVFINTTPTFVSTKGITSGTTLLKTNTWHVPIRAWTNLCKKTTNGGQLFLKVKGVDVEAKTSNPLKRFFSPVVMPHASK